MKTPGGWLQGYNAQAAVNENQIVLAGAVSQDATDVKLYQPMVAAVQAALAAAGVTEPIGTVRAAWRTHDPPSLTPAPDFATACI